MSVLKHCRELFRDICSIFRLCASSSNKYLCLFRNRRPLGAFLWREGCAGLSRDLCFHEATLRLFPIANIIKENKNICAKKVLVFCAFIRRWQSVFYKPLVFKGCDTAIFFISLVFSCLNVQIFIALFVCCPFNRLLSLFESGFPFLPFIEVQPVLLIGMSLNKVKNFVF